MKVLLIDDSLATAALAALKQLGIECKCLDLADGLSIAPAPVNHHEEQLIGDERIKEGFLQAYPGARSMVFEGGKFKWKDSIHTVPLPGSLERVESVNKRWDTWRLAVSSMANWKAHDGSQGVRSPQQCGYIDPQSLINLNAGVSTHEWMWGDPSVGLEPVITLTEHNACVQSLMAYSSRIEALYKQENQRWIESVADQHRTISKLEARLSATSIAGSPDFWTYRLKADEGDKNCWHVSSVRPSDIEAQDITLLLMPYRPAKNEFSKTLLDRIQFEKWVYSVEHPPYGWLEKTWLERKGESYASDYIHGCWTGYQYQHVLMRLEIERLADRSEMLKGLYDQAQSLGYDTPSAALASIPAKLS